MTRSHRLTRTLSAALAIGALAAPSAVAQPTRDHAFPHAVSPAPAPVNARGTDVRAPDQQAPAVFSQDLRSPDAADLSAPLNPQPVKSSALQRAGDDDGTPWSTIGLGLAGVCLALAGTAATAGRIRRRSGRAGVAA